MADKRGFVLPPPPPPLPHAPNAPVPPPPPPPSTDAHQAPPPPPPSSHSHVPPPPPYDAPPLTPPPPPSLQQTIQESALYFIDGKELSKAEMEKINPNSIKEINVLKGKRAIQKYGTRAEKGVIEITLKDNQDNSSNNSETAPSTTLQFDKNSKGQVEISNLHSNSTLKPNPLFTQVEQPASFPGGKDAWRQYIVQKIQAAVSEFTEKDYGTCLLAFIVDIDGSVSNVQALTMKGTRLGEISINAIRQGPKWIPAKQNGHIVAAVTEQPVTLTNPDSKK